MEPWGQQECRDTFTLEYWDECPYKAGDKVTSPVVDGWGNETSFIGDAHVYSMTSYTDCDRVEIIAHVARVYYVPALMFE